MVAVTLVGTEQVFVVPLTSAGVPGAFQVPTTTAAIAALAGNNGTLRGTFVLTGTTPVTVSNTNVALTSIVDISLNTVGGTVGAIPTLKTITAASGFTVAGTAADTSTYNYAIS